LNFVVFYHVCYFINFSTSSAKFDVLAPVQQHSLGGVTIALTGLIH